MIDGKYFKKIGVLRDENYRSYINTTPMWFTINDNASEYQVWFSVDVVDEVYRSLQMNDIKFRTSLCKREHTASIEFMLYTDTVGGFMKLIKKLHATKFGRFRMIIDVPLVEWLIMKETVRKI